MSVVFVLALVCFRVISSSLQADARQTVDGNVPCNSSTLEEVVTEIKTEIRDQINDVKKLLASNPTGLEAAEPTKQALVSAFLCEYNLVSYVNKYVGPAYCRAEMYDGPVACCPLVSHS